MYVPWPGTLLQSRDLRGPRTLCKVKADELGRMDLTFHGGGKHETLSRCNPLTALATGDLMNTMQWPNQGSPSGEPELENPSHPCSLVVQL